VTATTIKVSTQTRDRINELAAQQGITAGSLVEKVLQDYLWRQQVETAKQQMRSASREVRDEYLAESASWDVTSGDGLEDDPW
jgi:predicted transcriptional regulator